MRRIVYILTGPFILVGFALALIIGIPVIGTLGGMKMFIDWMDKGD